MAAAAASITITNNDKALYRSCHHDHNPSTIGTASKAMNVTETLRAKKMGSVEVEQHRPTVDGGNLAPP